MHERRRPSRGRLQRLLCADKEIGEKNTAGEPMCAFKGCFVRIKRSAKKHCRWTDLCFCTCTCGADCCDDMSQCCMPYLVTSFEPIHHIHNVCNRIVQIYVCCHATLQHACHASVYACTIECNRWSTRPFIRPCNSDTHWQASKYSVHAMVWRNMSCHFSAQRAAYLASCAAQCEPGWRCWWPEAGRPRTCRQACWSPPTAWLAPNSDHVVVSVLFPCGQRSEGCFWIGNGHKTFGDWVPRDANLAMEIGCTVGRWIKTRRNSDPGSSRILWKYHRMSLGPAACPRKMLAFDTMI